MSTSSGMSYATIESLPVRLGVNAIVEQGSTFSVTTTYINRTKRTVALTLRDGSRWVQEPTHGVSRTGELIIRQRYSLSLQMLEALRDDLSRRASREDRLLSRVRDVFEHVTADWGGNRCYTASVEYVVREEELDQALGRCYLSDVDSVVEWADLRLRRMNHPYSRGARAQSLLEDRFTNRLNDDSLAFSLRAIDNSGHRRISDRYINLGGVVYHIPIEQDASLEDGIHLTSRVSVTARLDKDFDGRELQQEHLSFAEADERFHLFDTIEKAMNHGSAADIVKERVAEATAQYKLDEAKLRAELLDKERELEHLKHSFNRDKMTHDFMSNEAKGFVEWLKLIGATMGVIVTVIGLAQKLKPS